MKTNYEVFDNLRRVPQVEGENTPRSKLHIYIHSNIININFHFY
jgi:hypothetical protein